MTRSLIRMAAGAAAITAVLLAGGPGVAVASADPGGHGSYSGDSRRGNSSPGPRSNRGVNGRPAQTHDQRQRSGDDDRRGNGVSGTPESPPSVASRGSVAPSQAQAVTASSIIADAAPRAAPGVPDAPSGSPTAGGSGKVAVARVPAPIAVPVVTFGNGRSPGGRLPADGSVPNQGVQVPAVAQAPPVTPQPVPPSVSVPAAAADHHFELSVGGEPPVPSLWDPAPSDRPTGALFGIAGLLLAPIAGVWLGYRQARASKSATRYAKL